MLGKLCKPFFGGNEGAAKELNKYLIISMRLGKEYYTVRRLIELTNIRNKLVNWSDALPMFSEILGIDDKIDRLEVIIVNAKSFLDPQLNEKNK